MKKTPDGSSKIICAIAGINPVIRQSGLGYDARFLFNPPISLLKKGVQGGFIIRLNLKGEI